jgi:hypothetical protein
MGKISVLEKRQDSIENETNEVPELEQTFSILLIVMKII